MERARKTVVLALLLGGVLLAAGTALAGNGIRPLSRHDAGTLSGGCWCGGSSSGYEVGQCEAVENSDCDTSASCTGQSPCDPSSMTEHETGTEYYCSTEECGSEGYHCKASNSGDRTCAYEYDCAVDLYSNCVKDEDNPSDVKRNISCSEHPIEPD